MPSEDTQTPLSTHRNIGTGLAGWKNELLRKNNNKTLWVIMGQKESDFLFIHQKLKQVNEMISFTFFTSSSSENTVYINTIVKFTSCIFVKYA